MKTPHPLAQHHNLLAGLVALGWNRDVASRVAFAYLIGRQLFANEIEDCRKVLKS